MSQLACGFISKSNRCFVFVLFGAFSGPEMVRGVGVRGGLASRDAASHHGSPCGEVHTPLPSSHVMPHGAFLAFLGRTHPQGALRRHVNAGHPSFPAACNEVMGWGPRDPLQIGGCFLHWPGNGQGDEKEEMMIILYVQPPLEVIWPEWIETERERERREGSWWRKDDEWKNTSPSLLPLQLRMEKGTVSLEHLAMS